MFTPFKNFISYLQGGSVSPFIGSPTTEISEDSILESDLLGNNNNINLTTVSAIDSLNEKNYEQIDNENFADCSLGNNTSSDPLMITEEDGERDTLSELPPISENEEHDIQFPASEVIVLEDPELNTSLISDPGTDPLAIEDSNLQSANQLENPSSDNSILYTVNINESEPDQPPKHDVNENVESQTPAIKTLDEHEIRSDGSDSGLGSETITTSSENSSICSTTNSSPVVEKRPLRSNLKRPHEKNDDNHQLEKKSKRAINFDVVKIFYFPRVQGYGCVPSQGGCTLGMAPRHVSFKTISLSEHTPEIRRSHKSHLQELNPRSSSTEESDSDEEVSEASGSDLDGETVGFLQPVPPKQRRLILKAAGIRKIDLTEKIECRNIRTSREYCGCSCRDFCDPDTCSCSQAGVKCQVDRSMFPCGCSRDACSNAMGRIEFNPSRVRTHFIHTMMRLEMEDRSIKRPEVLGSQHPLSPHLQYNNPDPTNSVNCYGSLTGYEYDSNSGVMSNMYHHQMQNGYMNHMPPGHSGNGAYNNLSNPMVTDQHPTPLCLPHPHNHYTSTTVAEVDSLTMNSNNMLYPDSLMYTTNPQPPISQQSPTGYNDVLTPYVQQPSYHHSTQLGDVTYTGAGYPSYDSTNHLQSNLHQHSQEEYVDYNNGCSDHMNGYSDTQSSFINLDTPEANSSRLTVLYNLLHNSRNSTPALEAVATTSSETIPPNSATETTSAVSECGSSETFPTDLNEIKSENNNSECPIEETREEAEAQKPLEPSGTDTVNLSDKEPPEQSKEEREDEIEPKEIQQEPKLEVPTHPPDSQIDPPKETAVDPTELAENPPLPVDNSETDDHKTANPPESDGNDRSLPTILETAFG